MRASFTRAFRLLLAAALLALLLVVAPAAAKPPADAGSGSASDRGNCLPPHAACGTPGRSLVPCCGGYVCGGASIGGKNAMRKCVVPVRRLFN